MLEYHLQTLLYEKECIVIPGFGAIITNYSPASISENRIVPPSKTLVFNESLQTNDGIVADQMARTENMNYAQALEAIRQEVKQWHQRLKAGQTLNLEGIGSFQKNENGKLVFKPAKNRNYLLETYGLEPAPLNPIETTVSTPSVTNKTKQLNRARTKRSRTPVTSIMAAAGLAFAIAMVSLVMYKNPGPSTIKGDLNIMAKDSPQTHVQKASDKTGNAPHQAGNPVNPSAKNLEKPAESPDKPNSRYFVITGSFQNADNAAAYKNRWASKGYNPKVIDNKEGWHRVSVGSYQDSLKAANSLQQIKASEKASAWLLKSKTE